MVYSPSCCVRAYTAGRPATSCLAGLPAVYALTQHHSLTCNELTNREDDVLSTSCPDKYRAGVKCEVRFCEVVKCEVRCELGCDWSVACGSPSTLPNGN